MILHLGHHDVSAFWRRIAARGDASFRRSADEFDLSHGKTPLQQLDLDAGEFGTLLKMQGPVTPHADDYIGQHAASVDVDGTPQNQLSAFWLTKLPAGKRHHEFWLQCGTDYCSMKEGDFVIFPHSVTHCVVTMANWEGIAWQLGSYKNVPNAHRLASLADLLPSQEIRLATEY